MAKKNEEKEKGSEKLPLQFKASLEVKPEQELRVMAYAFNREGELVATASVKEDQAELTLDESEAKHARIFFAPELPQGKGEREVTLETMERLRAYEPVWKFDPNVRSYEFLTIPDYLSKLWFWCSCRVRGRVVRPITIAGVTYDMPVCNARVHICEVDRLFWIILRLPDDIIWRLRDGLLEVIVRPGPISLPDPPPFKFDPSVIDPSPENIAKMNRAAIPTPRVPIPVSPLVERLGKTVGLNPQPLPPREQVNVLAELPIEKRAALVSNSLPIVKQSLIDNITLIRPYICLWDWLWPYLLLL